MSMFCYQCEQTAHASGCTAAGVCGKNPEVANLQDLLTYATLDIGRYAARARDLGVVERDIDMFLIEALFVTVTNVSFGIESMMRWIGRAAKMRNRAVSLYKRAASEKDTAPNELDPPVEWWKRTDDVGEMVRLGEAVTIRKRVEELGADVTGLQELILYGLKGTAAYMDHAQKLGGEDEQLYGRVEEMLDYLASDPVDVGELTRMALEVGAINLRAMELLDGANTGAYGDPEPTKVRVTPLAGKCIVVSGHDLRDLAMLLEQTAGKGINVYTHSEMLPCNAYPQLKKYPHLVGNYGGAWQDQQRDFEDFPGAILMTTNCIQKPSESYRNRIFTTGVVSWPGVRHIDADENGNKDFSPVIEAALAAEGFASDAPERYTMTGFAHKAVLGAADKVIAAVKAGRLRHFFLIGGCDGAAPGRNYYTDFARAVPDDCAILTLACGKYRFNKLQFGDIGGIPRLLDCGQCNDAYSAIRIASALAEAFDCGINDLPLSLVLSWFEQKAVAILLTLLHLGIRDIRLGPTLPAFITPPVLQVLVDSFGIKPISTVENDLEAILGATV